MPLFRRRAKLGPGRGQVTIRLYGPPTADEVTAAVIEREGNDELIPHLLGAYFDKILFNLSRMPREQEDLLDRFEAFVYENWERLGDEFDEDEQADPAVALVGVVPVSQDAPGKPLAEIRVELMMMEDKQRIGATTHFKPLTANNETVAELGLWALYDWLVLSCGGSGRTLYPLLDDLAAQCDHYRMEGMPGTLDLGRAPFEGAVEGARRRTAYFGSADLEEAPARENTADVVRTDGDGGTAPPAVPAATTDAWVCIQPRWEKLWRERDEHPLSEALQQAIEKRITRLDWGGGDVYERALSGRSDLSDYEGAVGLLLGRIALGGYLWREAERQVGVMLDQLPLGQVDFALGFAREQPSSREQQGEELAVTVAFWAMEGLAAPLTIHGGLQEPLVLAATHVATTAQRESGWDVGVPRGSRDDAFLYGYVLREAEMVVGNTRPASPETDESAHRTLDERARYVAKHIVDAGLAERCKVDLAYVDNGARLVLVAVHTFGTERIPVQRIEQLAREWLLADA